MQTHDILTRFRHWYRVDYANYLYHCTPEMMLSTAPPMYPGVRAAVCDTKNLDEVMSEIPNFHPVIARQVRQGDLALLGVTDEGWVFRSTAVIGPKIHIYDGYPLALTVEDAFLECAETIPSWRGKGVAPGMLGPTAIALAARGIRNIYLAIATTNAPSYTAAEKGGARRIGVFACRRRFGRWSARFQALPCDDDTLEPQSASTM